MKTVLITGATGFIGGSLVRHWASNGQVRVLAMARDVERGRRLRDWGAEVVQGDLMDRESLERACHDCDEVVHAGAWVGTWGDERLINATNVDGTRDLLAASADAGVRRFIHISSTGVYGSPKAHGVREDHPRRTTGQPYHDSKIGAEDEVVKAGERNPGLCTVILRPSHVFGPGSTHFTVRPLRMLLSGRAPLVAGGRFRFKPCWIGNLCAAIDAVAEADLPSGTALNITDGYTRSWRELFDRYAHLLGVEPRYINIPLPVARGLATAGETLGRVTGKKPFLGHETVGVLSSDNSYSSEAAQRRLHWSPSIGWDGAFDGMKSWVASRGGPEFLGNDCVPLDLL